MASMPVRKVDTSLQCNISFHVALQDYCMELWTGQSLLYSIHEGIRKYLVVTLHAKRLDLHYLRVYAVASRKGISYLKGILQR